MTIFTEITLRHPPQATMYADATGPFSGAAMQPYTMLGAQPPQSNSLADDLLVRLAGRQEGSGFWGITSSDVQAAGDMFAAKGDRVAFVGNDSATPNDKTALDAITYLKPSDVAALQDPANTATAAQFIGVRARVQLAEQNAPIVIAATGKYPEDEPTAQDFVNIYGAEDGPKRFDQFRTTAGVAKSFFDMYRAPNQAIHAELRDFEPGPNGSPEERERYEVRAGAAQLILRARDADPVAYISQIFPGEAPDWRKVSTPQDFQAAITWATVAQQQMGFDRKLPLPWAVADQEAKQYIDPSVPFNKRFARASSIVLAIRDPGARRATAEQLSLAAEAQWRARAAQDQNMTPELLEAQLTALRAGLAWIGEHPAQAQYSTMSSLQQFGMAFGDIGRTIAKGATAGGADALVAGMAPSESGESYDERLGREQAETEDAEDRAGVAGWVAEGLGAGLSGYGAAKGLFGLLGRAGVGAAAESGLTGLGARTAVGAATGGAYGGAYAYNTGESVPWGIANGALWGAGGNVLAEGLSAIGRQVMAKITRRFADPPEPSAFPKPADTATNQQIVDTTPPEPPLELGTSNSETNSGLIGETPAGHDIHVYHMRKWNAAQREAAALKAQRLSDSDASVNRNSVRDSKSARRRYIEAGNEVAPDEDVDHILDLQLNGSEEFSNLAALDRSVNRSFGPQIKNRIKNLPHGAKINKVTIGDR